VRFVLAQRRYEHILQRLRSDGPAGVRALAGELRVSEATVRRDLARLEHDGLLQRVRGGATVGSLAEPPFEEVAGHDSDEKAAVAARAAGIVEDGDVVLLDVGTTVHRLARLLRGRPVTVITSNLAVYEELVDDEAVEIVLLGGVVRRNYRSLVGFLTEQALGQVHARHLFLGTSGIRRDGTVLDTTVVEVPVKQAMIRAADHVVLLADQAKFPGTGLARVCGPESVAVLVTGPDADPATLSCFREAGTEVVLT